MEIKSALQKQSYIYYAVKIHYSCFCLRAQTQICIAVLNKSGQAEDGVFFHLNLQFILIHGLAEASGRFSGNSLRSYKNTD